MTILCGVYCVGSMLGSLDGLLGFGAYLAAVALLCYLLEWRIEMQREWRRRQSKEKD